MITRGANSANMKVSRRNGKLIRENRNAGRGNNFEIRRLGINSYKYWTLPIKLKEVEVN